MKSSLSMLWWCMAYQMHKYIQHEIFAIENYFSKRITAQARSACCDCIKIMRTESFFIDFAEKIETVIVNRK